MSKTMTPEQRAKKNEAQKVYRAKKKLMAELRNPLIVPGRSTDGTMITQEMLDEARGVEHVGLPTREESDAARAMTEDHDEPLPPVLDPAMAAPITSVEKLNAAEATTYTRKDSGTHRRAPRRAVADLPTRVFAARIPHGRYDEIKAMAKRADVSICDLILQGIDLLAARTR